MRARRARLKFEIVFFRLRFQGEAILVHTPRWVRWIPTILEGVQGAGASVERTPTLELENERWCEPPSPGAVVAPKSGSQLFCNWGHHGRPSCDS